MLRSFVLRSGWPVLALCLLNAFWPDATFAQLTSRSAPHDGYWACFEPYLDGDFRTAGREFREAAKHGIVNMSTTVGGPWIDAICYHTMIGECSYQMGDVADALDQYTAALKLFLAHRDWMLRIEFPAGIDVEHNLKTTVTWGKSSRGTALGH